MPPEDDNLSVGDMGETVTIPNTNTPEAQEFPEFKTLVPKDYAEKGWVGEIKDVPAFFKMFDDQKIALSRRAGGVPDWETASDEEKASFNKALGVPEAPEGYEITRIEGQEVNEKWEGQVKDLFHKSGLSTRQAKAMETGFNELVTGLQAEMGVNAQKSDEEFDKLAKEVYGENEELALKITKGYIDKLTPDSLKDGVDDLSNRDLLRLSSVIFAMHKEYVGEDKLPDDFDEVELGLNQADKIAKGTALMASDAYKDWQHPDHKNTVEKVNAYFGN